MVIQIISEKPTQKVPNLSFDQIQYTHIVKKKNANQRNHSSPNKRLGTQTGSFSSHLISLLSNQVNHHKTKGQVSVQLFMSTYGDVDWSKTTVKSKNKILQKHTRAFLYKNSLIHKKRWQAIGRNEKLKIEFFYLGKVVDRDLDQKFARTSFVNDDTLVIFLYSRIKKYNYSNGINLGDLLELFSGDEL